MSEAAAPVEPLPSTGGSYVRQPDGTLQRVDDAGPAQQPDAAEAAAQAHTQDPQE